MWPGRQVSGDLILRQAEQHVDGIDLRDADDAVDVGDVQDIAGIDLAQADLPVQGRADLGVRELQTGIVTRRLVHGDDGLVLAHQGVLGDLGLLGDRILRQQITIALLIDLGVGQQLTIAIELRLGLGESDAIGRRIDERQQLSGLHLVAFMKKERL